MTSSSFFRFAIRVRALFPTVVLSRAVSSNVQTARQEAYYGCGKGIFLEVRILSKRLIGMTNCYGVWRSPSRLATCNANTLSIRSVERILIEVNSIQTKEALVFINFSLLPVIILLLILVCSHAGIALKTLTFAHSQL